MIDSLLQRLREHLRRPGRDRPTSPVGPDAEATDVADAEVRDVVAEVEALLRDDTEGSVAEAVRVGRAPEGLATPDLVALAGRFLVTGHGDLARDLVEETDRRGTDDLKPPVRRRLDNLRTWTHAAVPDPPAGAVPLGIFYYQQPDRGRGSSNIGDYVQTLSMLGNLVRFSDVEFTGADGLGDLATELQKRVRPEFRLASESRRVHLVPVSRDFSQGDPIPEDTWLVAFGWHLHGSYDLRFGLPYHPRLRPLFVSFHLHAIDALDDATVEYLRTHGPIGCRDWTTVDLLLSAGVDAFFTGCVTTTVDAVFPSLDSLDRSGAHAIGVIDTAAPDDLPDDQLVAHISNGNPRHRDLDLVRGTRAAIAVLENYQLRLSRVVTSRLHAYLPATSLGLEVDCKPTIPGDGRFAGVSGLRPGSPELDAMRDTIRDLVAGALTSILADAPADEVYAAWRERTAPLVEQARARLHAPHAPVPPVSTAALRERLEQAPPVELGRTAHGGRAAVWAVGTATTAADVLALPALLPEVDRLVVVDSIDAAGQGDLVRLAEVDLLGNPAAARLSSRASAWTWRAASHRLASGPAAELRRVMSARHPYATRAIEPGAIVLDLGCMRADADLPDCLALATHFGLDAHEGLLAYAGPRVTSL